VICIPKVRAGGRREQFAAELHGRGYVAKGELLLAHTDSNSVHPYPGFFRRFNALYFGYVNFSELKVYTGNLDGVDTMTEMITLSSLVSEKECGCPQLIPSHGILGSDF
jgi:hypothetical protein